MARASSTACSRELRPPAGVSRWRIVTASIDERLNDHGYIMPGLGDAGDRMFGSATSLPVSARGPEG